MEINDGEFFVVTPLSFPVRRIGTAVNCKLKKPKQQQRWWWFYEDDVRTIWGRGAAQNYDDYEDNVDDGGENYEEEEVALVYSEYLVPFSTLAGDGAEY